MEGKQYRLSCFGSQSDLQNRFSVIESCFCGWFFYQRYIKSGSNLWLIEKENGIIFFN